MTETNKFENSMSSFFERLEKIMKHFNIKNVNQLAFELGYDAAEKINRLKKAENRPSYDIIADILKKWPEINGNWLVLGEGNMLEEKDEQHHIREGPLKEFLKNLTDAVTKLNDSIDEPTGKNNSVSSQSKAGSLG